MSETGGDTAIGVRASNDVVFLVEWFLRYWWKLFAALLLGASLGLAASYLVTPIYAPEVVLSFSIEDSNAALGRAGGDLSNIASLVGVNVGGNGADSEELMALLQSRTLGNRFIEAERLQSELLGAPGLRSAFGDLLLSEDHPERRAREAYKRFADRVRDVVQDRKTNLVRVSLRWTDPQLAAQWSNRYVALADEVYRKQQLARHQARALALQQRLDISQTAEVRVATARLLEGELKLIMSASTRGDFALRVIDPAVPPLPSERQSPRRFLYALVGSLAVSSLAMAVFWWRPRLRAV